MDSSKIKAIVLAIFATFAALYLGISSATAQFETIAWVVGGLTFIGCLALGRKIWLLIPFAVSLDFLLGIPGTPSPALLAQLLVLGFCMPLFFIRKLPYAFRFTELEFWVLVLAAFVFQAYARNPVGLNLFGGQSVGGKPYLLFAIAVASCLLLSGLRVPERELKWLVPISICGGLLNAILALIGHFVPVVGYYMGSGKTASDEMNYSNFGGVEDAGAARRIGALSTLGKDLALWISAFVSPLKACLHPLWGTLILVSVGAVMMGGFRNGLISLGLTYVIGIAYRHGIAGLLLSSFGAAAGIALLAMVNLINPLPPNIQRSLTFLPGTWEQRHKDDAKGSTEWRVEIWKEALLTDRWIHNKLMGDGMGFSATELAAQMTDRQGARAGISGFDAHREAVLANGDYHSGPVSFVRTIGYIGLAVFILMQIRLAILAHRQIRRCKGTSWQPVALLTGIPLIVFPFFFLFVFGDFKADVVTFLLGVGMIRLLQNNLPLPAYAHREQLPFTHLPAKPEVRRPHGFAHAGNRNA